MNYDFNDEVESKYESEEKVERAEKFVEENLAQKLEKSGSKIRFADDVKALYRYMKDRNVAWYRKSIVVCALIYFISPIDTVPDIAPLIGYLDDLGVIMAVVKFLGREILPYYD